MTAMPILTFVVYWLMGATLISFFCSIPTYLLYYLISSRITSKGETRVLVLIFSIQSGFAAAVLITLLGRLISPNVSTGSIGLWLIFLAALASSIRLGKNMLTADPT